MPGEPASSEPAGSVEADLGAVVFRRVRGHHAFEACVEQLATAIRLGVYPGGASLPPERELAQRMQVSRATLREAIAALRTAGMLRTVRGRGGGSVVVDEPEEPAALSELRENRVALLDSLVFRRIVEPGAAYVAATTELTGEQRWLLTTALTEVSNAAGRNAHRQADSRLHLAIASVTGSRLLIDAVTQAQAHLHELLNAIPVLEVNITHSTAQHHAIIEAILEGDGPRARRAMEQHCDDTAALLRGLLG